MSVPTLPQQTSPAELAERNRGIAWAQTLYQWAHSHTYSYEGKTLVLAPIAVLEVDDAHPLPEGQNLNVVQILEILDVGLSLLSNAIINKPAVTARVKELKVESGKFTVDSGQLSVTSELEVLEKWLKLNNDEAELKRGLKDSEADLDAKAYAHYPKLTEAEVKTLVVEDKWLAALEAAIQGEMDRVSQSLTQRVKELSERYETPMPQLTARVDELEAKVNQHLEKMGFSWK